MSKAWTDSLAEFLKKEPGVEAVRLDLAAHTVSIAQIGELDEKKLQKHLDALLAKIDSSLDAGSDVPKGFVIKKGEDGSVEFSGERCPTVPHFWKWKEYNWHAGEDEEEEHDHDEDWRILGVFAGLCGVLGLAGFIIEMTGGALWVSRVFYVLALIAGGWDAAIDSVKFLKKGRVDIHFLMMLVAIGAMCIGAWAEAVLLLFLFSSSGAMEAYASDRTHREIGALLKSAPKEAIVLDASGEERLVAVEALQLGDRVLVKPGEAYPADGEVVKGESASDESAITGEATPVEKGIGSEVFSGTVNQWGVVEFKVNKLPEESTLKKIIRLIETAQKLKAPSQRFTDKFGQTYTLSVMGICALMFFIWWLGFGIIPFEGTGSAFYRAMTLLVVMSPCALVLSIPSAILAAIAWGARHGVLFRGGAAVERLSEVGVVALDKTGTLTTGELAVVGYESFPAGKESELMSLAYSLEANSTHPLARAIVKDAKARGAVECEVTNFESLTGQGLRGTVDGKQVLIGRRELLERGGELSKWMTELPVVSAELSEVWVLSSGVIGRVLLRDEIRKESKDVLSQLKSVGVKTVMLTGDRRHAAESVAKELGLDEVRAGLTPEGKVHAVEELKKDGRLVAMVGDGVNDAPSLAAADVSIAMGARGSDAALEQAEVVVMHDRIENVLAAFRLSRRARRIIKINLGISLGVVVIMAIAAIFGIIPLSVGVFAHEGSTFVVCINSLRLLLGDNKGGLTG